MLWIWSSSLTVLRLRVQPGAKYGQKWTIRNTYPEIQIIGSSGPNSEGDQFDYLWPEIKRLQVDLVNEYFYRPESWFLSQGNRYDRYDRKGPKVLAGEYACHGQGKKWNHFNAALLETAFMTGMERNADVIHMATYAPPLFARTEGWQWRPDMIWFDNLHAVRTSSYYVQQLFSRNKGNQVLPLTMNQKPVAGNDDQYGLFASAVWDNDTREIIVKVVNTSGQPQKLAFNFDGLTPQERLTNGTCIQLRSNEPRLENTLEQSNLIQPDEFPIQFSGKTL